eukprot:m.447369 g.447369  ORF g.447369 m.447369 type:complete len:72 (+) comp20315_c4_seq1:397-612(+)
MMRGAMSATNKCFTRCGSRHARRPCLQSVVSTRQLAQSRLLGSLQYQAHTLPPAYALFLKDVRLLQSHDSS